MKPEFLLWAILVLFFATVVYFMNGDIQAQAVSESTATVLKFIFPMFVIIGGGFLYFAFAGRS
jgi:hypothetical protein